MTYELINPSDKMTATGEWPIPALGIAVIWLGEGVYGLKDENGNTVVPIVAFGGIDAMNSWFEGQGLTLDEAIDRYTLEAADFLDALKYGGKRSSMNDIGGRAKLLAEQFRTAHGTREGGAA